MKNLQIRLTPNADQLERLHALQRAFSEVCNALAPVARESRCWNRVALHHMTYHAMRERYPQIGSQMVCNAIYSVSRTCRLVYQSPASPFNVARLGDKPLPLVRFAPNSPVFFDRHTLSIKEGQLSMYTLDGRIRFNVNLSTADERRFREEKLLEIVLSSRDDVFSLNFVFGASKGSDGANGGAKDGASAQPQGATADLPQYVRLLPQAQPVPAGDSE